MSNAFFGVRRCNTTPGAAALVALAVLASAGCDKSTPAPKGHGVADAGVAVSSSALTSNGCTSATYNGHDYLLCASAKSWDAARSDCIASGMELVKIDDAAENTFVKQHAPGFGSSWIGATDAAAQGTWKWSVDGSVLGYTNWSFLQPDGFLHEDCANLQQFDGDWNATLCSLSLPYVCEEIPPVTPPPPVTADTSCWNSASLQKDSPWPMRGLCPLRRGASKFVGSQVNTINWTFPSGAIRTAVAIGADGTLYYGSEDSYLYAVTKTGTQRWRFHTSGAVRSSPALTANGLVIFGSEDHFLYGLDANTGAQRFRTDLHGAVTSSPTVAADGTIVVGADDDRIHALDGSTGAERWSYLTGADVDSSPAIGPDGTIYCGSDDDKLVALRPDPGLTDAQRLRWSMNLGSDVNAAPVIGPAPDNAIYVRTQNSRVVKLAAADGHQLASFQGPTDPDADGGLALGLDGTLYAALEHKLYALHPDLTVAWLFSTGGDVRTTPAVGADGVIYFGADDQKFYAVKPNGSALWSVTSSAWFGQGAFRGSAAIGKSGTIYCGSDEGKLYAIGSFACSTAHPCTNGMGPCTADSGCGVGLSCGYGVAERFGLPADFGVCWDPKDCATFAPADCGNYRTQCGDCCVPNCSSAGSSDHCGHTCQACVPGADTDKDGILDCDEYSDGSDWTNALVANGVRAQQGPSCSASPTCGAIDTEAEIAACFAPAESQVLSSGWNFSTANQNLCDAGFGFSPTWSSCRDDFAVDYSTVLRLEQGGRHCFLLGGSTTSQCASLFVEGLTGSPGVTLQTTTGNAVCADLAAGTYNLHWFYENAGPASNALSVEHCFGGTTDCAPTLPIATKELLPPGPVPACDARPAVCSERCPCSAGQVCDPSNPKPLCALGLECKVGVGDHFGLAANTPVCWEPACEDHRSPQFSCGSTTSTCGVCPACTTNCAGKSCGYDGCWGSCGETCGAGQAGCEKDGDCSAGNVCLTGAGPAFGRAVGLNVCAPAMCQSLTSTNPCNDPSNQGKMTACGVCPTLAHDCAGKVCGDDSAGGSCGPTPLGKLCIDGQFFDWFVQSSLPSVPGRPAPAVATTSIGTLSGSFAVNHAGNATYNLPLPLPVGRGGLTPSLALNYNHSRGNGFLGAGWALGGMEAITRCDRTIAQDGYVDTIHFDDSDALCLNGERLIPVGPGMSSGMIFYALENNDFSSIVSHAWPASTGMHGPKYFELTTRDGTIKSFGDDDLAGQGSARILGPGRPTATGLSQADVVHTWALSKVADRFGNYASYWYEERHRGSEAALSAIHELFEQRREYYPAGILYSVHEDPRGGYIAGQAWVSFEYDDSRSDALDYWRSGVNVQTNRLLKQISAISLLDGSSRSFKLHYDDGAANGPPQNRLNTVEHCVKPVWNGSQEHCLPKTRFDYERHGGLLPTQDQWTSDNYDPSTSYAVEAVLDFDGDGRDDLLSLDRGVDVLELSRSAGASVSFQRVEPVRDAPHFGGSSAPVGPTGAIDLHVLDWNGDGRDDLLDLKSQYVYISAGSSDLQTGSQDPYRFIRQDMKSILQQKDFVLDLNGDGRMDLLRCNAGKWRYALGEAVQFGQFSAEIAPAQTPLSLCPAITELSESAAQVIDSDGDGAQELLFVQGDLWGRIMRPIRSEKWQLLKLTMPHSAGDVATAKLYDTSVPWTAKPIDLNGDGLSDFYQIDGCLDTADEELTTRSKACMHTRKDYGFERGLNPNTQYHTWLNRGEASDGKVWSFVSSASGDIIHRDNYEQMEAAAVVVDYDGDGRQDILLPPSIGTSDTWFALRSTGSGFQQVAGQGGVWGVRVPEIVRGTDAPISWALAASVFRPVALDLNGDGLSDLIGQRLSTSNSGGFFVTNTWTVSLHDGQALPRMTSVTDGLGARTNISYGLLADPASHVYNNYAPLVEIADLGCTYPQRCTIPRRTVVSSTAVGRDDAGTFAAARLEQTYKYIGARADLQGRGSLGFRDRIVTTTTVQDPLGYSSTTEYGFVNFIQDSDTKLYYDALVPEIVRTSTTQGSTTVTSVEYHIHTPTMPQGAPHTLFSYESLRSVVEYEQVGANSPSETRRWATEVAAGDLDIYGNPTLVQEGVPGFVFAIDPSAPEGLHKTALTYMYATDPANFDAPGLRHLVDRRTETFEQGAASSPWGDPVSHHRVTAFEYLPNGALHATVVEPDASVDPEGHYVRTEYARDLFGNVVTKTETIADGSQRSETVEYPSGGQAMGCFPLSMTNAIGQTTSLDVNPITGAVTRSTDPNGAMRDTIFDDFGRIGALVDVDNTVTTVSYSASANGEGFVVHTRTEGGTDQTVTYDSYGRPVETLQKGALGTDLVSDTTYDDLGRVSLQSRPHVSTGNPLDPLYVSAFGYDVRGRLVGKAWQELTNGQLVARSTSTCYAGLQFCTTDPRGRTSCKEHDQLGRVLKTWDPTVEACGDALNEIGPNGAGVRGPSTVYGYGEQLERVTDPSGSDTRIVVDDYGRKLAISDPSTGVTRSVYDGFGELKQSTDANGQVTTYAYDAVGRRVERRDGALGSVPEKVTNWYFDGAEPGDPTRKTDGRAGRLTLSLNPEQDRQSYTYDTLGRLTQETLAPVDGAPLSVGYENYQHGRATIVRYPTVANQVTMVHRGFDPYGHLVDVRRSTGVLALDAVLPAFWQMTQTDALGLASQEALGGTSLAPSTGVIDATTRDNIGRVERMETLVDGTSMRRLDLGYDPGGNLAARVEGSQVEIFDYDDLSRLKGWSVGAVTTTIDYDPNGNIRSRDGLGTYRYEQANAPDPQGMLDVAPVKPFAVTSVGTNPDVIGFRYAYDMVGNLKARTASFAGTSREDHFDWTPFGKVARMWSTDVGGSTERDVVDFRYDADCRRIVKENHTNAIRTTYLGGLFERRMNTANGTVDNVFYFGNGSRVVAQMTVHEDAVSSTSTLEYLHADHLGSTELVTTAQRTTAQQLSFDPFGRPRDPNNWASAAVASLDPSMTVGFTGHEQPDEGGLVNMIGRMYDPIIGRFVSADPFVQAPYFSQSLNRYSYVMNNPLSLVDPSGYQYGATAVIKKPSANGDLDFSSGFSDHFSGTDYLYALLDGLEDRLAVDIEKAIETAEKKIDTMGPGQKIAIALVVGAVQVIPGVVEAEAVAAAEAATLVEGAEVVAAGGEAAATALEAGSAAAEASAAEAAGAEGAAAGTEAAAEGAASRAGPVFPGTDPKAAPEGFEWRGKAGSEPGSGDGNFFNPRTGESLRPDLEHPDPIGPHWDYRSPDGTWFRISPDGRITPK